MIEVIIKHTIKKILKKPKQQSHWLKQLWHEEEKFSVENMAQCSINEGMHTPQTKLQKPGPDTI